MNNLQDAAEQLKAYPLMTDLLTPAKRGFICIDDACRNGSGEDSTGAEIKDNRLMCGKCQGVFSNIDIIANHLRIGTTGKDFVAVIKFGCQRAGIPFDSDSFTTNYIPKTPPLQGVLNKKEKSEMELAQDAKELALIQDDIAAAHKNLHLLPDDWRRGLNLETLDEFNCGFIKDWTSPKSRIAGKYATPTPRIIIPSVNCKHYLARLTVDVETYDEKTRPYIKTKPHAGTMATFGLQTLAAANFIVFLFEGEINALSCWQVWQEYFKDTRAGFIANCGAANDFWYDDLDAVYGSNDKKPLIVIVGDNDDTGRKTSEKHRVELLKRGYPTFVQFFSDGDEKIDANYILTGKSGLTTSTGDTNGTAVLAEKLLNFSSFAEENLAVAEAEIEHLHAEYKAADEEELKQEIQRRIERAFAIAGCNDLANARRLAVMHGDLIRFILDLDKWTVYKNGVWNIDTTGKNTVLLPLVAKVADSLAKNARTAEESKVAEKFSKQRYVAPALTFLKSIDGIYITQKDLDTHKNLINCLNGVVDLQSGKLYPHSPQLLLTQKANANFRFGYRNATVEKFLRDVQTKKDNRAALLSFLGYCLTGETREEKFLFIDGEGGNGKGTLTGLLVKVLGNFVTNLPARAFMLHKQNDANNATPVLNALIGKRLGCVEELPPNVKLDVAFIKNLTGNDKIYFRRLHAESDSFDGVFKLILSGNNLPELVDANDKGLKRRLLRLPFTQDFNGANCDVHLKNRLFLQDSLDGFFSLLVANARKWYEDGLFISDDMKAAAQEYIIEQDFLAEFVKEHCTFREGAKIKRADFVSKLRDVYSVATAKISDRALTDMLKKIEGVEYKRTEFSYCLWGIEWKDTKENSD